MMVETLTPGQCLALGDDIGAIYHAAFARAPYHRSAADAKQFVRRIRRHMGYGGFRFLVVRSLPDMALAGFAYGYRSETGQAWHDHVAKVLGPVRSARLLDGALELAEFAIHPSQQGRGFGAVLYSGMFDTARERRAILSTATARTRALKFYRQRGWVTIVPEVLFAPGSMPYRLMGLRLQKGRTSAIANT